MTTQPRLRSQKSLVNNLVNGALDHRLLLYAMAAGATLATSSPSQAEVLFTPNSSVLRSPSSLAIDLNHDGVLDFRLVVRQFFETTSSFAYGFVGAAFVYGRGPSNKVAVSNFSAPIPLKRGEQINTRFKFRTSGPLAKGLFFWGPFDKTQNRFLGVEAVVNGEVHFGWIGFRRVDDPKNVQLTLAGWAYETVPNKAIVAGDTGNGTRPDASIHPTSLEILAAGHSGIAERRKRTDH